jgi:hypothetical protein
MNRLYISIFLFISFISSSYCQDVKVSASIDSSRIYIGDQIHYSITIDQPSGIQLTVPILKDTLLKNIDILAGPVIDSSTVKDGRYKIIQKYLISSYDSGFYQIPPVYAELKTESGLKRYFSDYTQLEVMRVKIAPADTTLKIFDIIKPYRAPVTLSEILPWVLLAAVIGVILWFAIRYFRKLKFSKKGIEVVEDPDPAHIIAFRELERLKEEQLWQKGEIKTYYTRLTEILRQYLENRFKVFSLELTTSETLEALIKSGFKKDASYNLLKSILTGADLVKFAKHIPEPDENESHFQNSWDFVLSTKVEEAIPEKGVEKEKSVEGKL